MRILFASTQMITPPTTGGVQRTALLLAALQQIGEVDVVFLPARDSLLSVIDAPQAVNGRRWVEPTDRIASVWLQRSPLGRLLKLHGSLGAFLGAGRHRWEPYPSLVAEVGDIGRYDLVVARYLSAACVMDLFRHPRLVIDVDDYDPDRLRQRLANASWFKRLTLKRCLKYSEEAHYKLLSRAGHCWVSNPADRLHAGLANATLLPNIPYALPGKAELKSESFELRARLHLTANE